MSNAVRQRLSRGTGAVSDTYLLSIYICVIAVIVVDVYGLNGTCSHVTRALLVHTLQSVLVTITTKMCSHLSMYVYLC